MAMARLGRYFLPDQPLHVIQRGNNRQPIFFAEQDYLGNRNRGKQYSIRRQLSTMFPQFAILDRVPPIFGLWLNSLTPCCHPRQSLDLDSIGVPHGTGEIPEWPLTISESCLRLTPSFFAASVTLNPSGSRQSCRTDSPGWGRFFSGMSRFS
jgi:hypothetical protein